MDLKIENGRAKTVGTYDVRMLKALPRLEGSKRWLANRAFSFEASRFNLEVWRDVFPAHTVDRPEGSEPALGSPRKAPDWEVQASRGRPAFAYRTPPRAHQSAALEKLSGLAGAGLFMDVGTGKSWTAIALAGQRWCRGEIDRVLLVAKNGVHQQWVNSEIPKHMSDSVTYKAWAWKSKTKQALREWDDLISFEGLKIFAINIDALITKDGENRILDFLHNARSRTMMVVDESQDIKNLSASRTKAAIKFGANCRYRLIMTGTPIAKNVVDLFSQFKFLDEDILGSRYITSFRARYCIMRQTDYGQQIVGHQNIDELYRKIDPYIFRITSQEALDLPPKIYEQRTFVLSDEQLHLIKELRNQFYVEAEKKEFSTVKNAAGLLTRIQQISCGYLPMDDGSFKELKNPRMAELMNIIDQRSGKIIVWCRFNKDIENVCRELGYSAVSYFGGTSSAQREVAIREFMDEHSSVRIFVASPEAAGTGLNLQGLCNTNIYYSNSFNALARWQSEGRTWRDGTRGSVAYFDLIARKSPDAKILRNLQDKKSIADLTLDDFRNLFALEDEG